MEWNIFALKSISNCLRLSYKSHNQTSAKMNWNLFRWKPFKQGQSYSYHCYGILMIHSFSEFIVRKDTTHYSNNGKCVGRYGVKITLTTLCFNSNILLESQVFSYPWNSDDIIITYVQLYCVFVCAKSPCLGIVIGLSLDSISNILPIISSLFKDNALK